MADDDAAPTGADLGSLFARALPRLMAMEEPILRDAGLSMWEYSIATALASQVAVSQVELSARTRRDPTRLGHHLDDLVERGLVTRERSADGRQRTVSLTPEGRRVFERTKQRIRAAEDELLAGAMPAADAAALRRLLATLADD